jgi:hypothetical protein
MDLHCILEVMALQLGIEPQEVMAEVYEFDRAG